MLTDFLLAWFRMTCLHPFNNSRESVLQMWAQNTQARRQAPDAKSSDLFIALHGMLFTNIQLDDFKPVLARFEEKLLLEGTLHTLPVALHLI